MADDPCEAVFAGATPTGPRKYYRARYYDPMIGRFISEDPIGFLGGINFYPYANDRPTILTDPSGLLPDAAGVVGSPVACIQSMRMANGLALTLFQHQIPGPEADKRAHCLAFCHMRKGCGAFLGGFVLNVGIGLGKESFDTACWTHFEIIGMSGPCTTPGDIRDIDANMHGANCPVEVSCESRCSDPSSFR
jgi:RHS repeat-associated protein